MTFSLALRLTTIGALALAGCSSGDTQSLADRVVIEEANIQGVTIAISKDTIAVTEVLPLSAFDSVDGTNITDSVRWSSSDSSVATVEGAGIVTTAGQRSPSRSR